MLYFDRSEVWMSTGCWRGLCLSILLGIKNNFSKNFIIYSIFCSKFYSNAKKTEDFRYIAKVTCNGFSGFAEDFRTYMKKLDSYEIDELVINNYFTSYLPEDTFTKAIIKKISIINSPNLMSFGDKNSGKSFFDNLGSGLETLVLSNTPNIKQSQWRKVTDSLKIGTGSNFTDEMNLSNIQYGYRSSGPAIKTLILYKNGDSTLRDLDDFIGLTNVVRLTGRSIGLSGEIQTDFSGFLSLRVIDLSENRLISFNPKGIPPALHTIILNKNLIKIFDQSFITTLVNFPFGQMEFYIDIRCESFKTKLPSEQGYSNI